jgi:ABC-type antimicrobial peptide transport system permease subunit
VVAEIALASILLVGAGLRMALGAERGTVLRLVIGEGLLSALLGLSIGLGGALALSRLLAGMLFAAQPTDLATFAAVALLFSAVALAATYVPARRATAVDPMAALRHE